MLREFLVATFSEEDSLRTAVRRIREAGFKIHDVYAPYPVHGLDRLMGLPPSRLPVIAFLAGLAGGVATMGTQFYLSVFDWGLNVGGKPPNSTLAFIPITFEVTVLSAGLATAVALLARCRLFPGAQPARFETDATEDAFALVLRRREATFDAGEARRLLLESGARNVTVKRLPS